MKRTGFKKKTLAEIQSTPRRPLKRAKLRSKALTSRNGTKARSKTSTLAKLKKRLWQLCREIQIKRYGSDCYTCPSKNLSGSSRHLGHFIPSSICSTPMRYDLDNLRVQCYSCNIHKSGNWVAYEKHLIQDGVDVQELKDRNEKTKGGMFREDWYEEKIAQYSLLLENMI